MNKDIEEIKKHEKIIRMANLDIRIYDFSIVELVKREIIIPIV